jgi:hypothetical protein
MEPLQPIERSPRDASAPDVSCALVLETNNLRGGDEPGLVVASLARLLRHLGAQTRSLGTLRELVITHDGLDAVARTVLERAAARPIAFVELPEGAGYYEAKNRGFDATTAEVVAFGDGDCWPDAAWLETLLAPFAEPDAAVQVVAGRTTYRDDVLGAATTAIDFMYFPTPFGPGCTRNFYANNVAFRRDVFARFRYLPAADVYRGHCQQLGFRLHAAGVPIRFAPAARTVHRFPDSARELVRLRFLRGADTVAVAPSLARAVLPERLGVVGRLPGVTPLIILAVRMAFSARAVNRQDLTPARGWGHAARLAGVLGISALDAAGALARAAGITDLGVRDGSLDRGRLAYHGNVDALVEGSGAPRARPSSFATPVDGACAATRRRSSPTARDLSFR